MAYTLHQPWIVQYLSSLSYYFKNGPVGPSTNSLACQLIASLIGLFMMANTQAYMLSIYQISGDNKELLLYIKITPERILGDKKSEVKQQLNLESAKTFALQKLNSYIRRAGLEPKTTHTFKQRSGYQQIITYNTSPTVWYDHHIAQSHYTLETKGGNSSKVTFMAHIDASHVTWPPNQ